MSEYIVIKRKDLWDALNVWIWNRSAIEEKIRGLEKKAKVKK